jgi:acyl-CoA thioester hydrolase
MDIETPAELADFPVVIQVPVLWGDQDKFAHVNNTVYFRWFESARVRYFDYVGLGEGKPEDNHLGPILAAIGANYRRPLNYPDTVLIGARVSHIGRTSLAIDHAVWSHAQQAIVADGHSTIVVFDYSVHKPHVVPDEMRRAIEKLQNSKFADY